MKKQLTAIISAVLAFFFCYSIGAFTQVSFDLSKWSEEARGLTGFIGGFISLFSFAYSYDNYKD